MRKLEPRDSIPAREGDNALVSYQFNVVTDPDGVRVAASNCLSCHASHLFGRVVIGLGHPNMAMLQGESTGASFDIPGMGDAHYDLDRLGWKFDVNGLPGFDTTTPGNSNKGHVYGASLSGPDRKALLEHLKTL